MPRRKSNLGRDTKRTRKKRLKIKNETDEQREFRLSKERERTSLRRSRETSVEREQRLRRVRERNRFCKDRELSKRKRNKIPENFWSNEVNSEMNENSSIEYKYEPVDSLGTMSVLCENCSALLWKGESEGLCCLPRKVKLEEILPPPEPVTRFKYQSLKPERVANKI